MEAFGLLLQGFGVLLTWKILALMMVGLVLGIFVGVLPGLGGPNGVVHLLGRAVRRGDHFHSVQYPGRGLVGGDHI